MKAARRTAWWVYGAAAAGVLAALAVVTAVVLELEGAEALARRDAEHREALRLALWRLDSWLGRELDREASRPVADYLAPGAGATLLPGVRFELEGGDWERQAAEGPTSGPPDPSLTEPALRRRLAAGEAQLGAILDAAPVQSGPRPEDPLAQSRQELAWRARNALSQRAVESEPLYRGSWNTGPVVALWWSEAELCLARRAVREGAERLQGLWVEWPELERALLSQVGDLLHEPDLVAERDNDEAGPGALVDPSPDRLASLPARLVSTLPPAAPPGLATPTRLTLFGAWIATLLGLAGAALVLRTTQAYAETRHRFAQAIAHELRTPLTTFQMYAEMLREGMVTGEQRTAYLATLQRESKRLSALVEKALDFARLESGRPALRRRPVESAELIEHVRGDLEARAREASVELIIEAPPGEGAALETDPDVVGWILLQLVDNACKYAADGGPLRLEVDAGPRRVTLRLRDGGPGIAPSDARRIFEPFERATAGATAETPGVGLGLSLARGMARELGGDLRLEPASGSGACFTLTLPR